MGTQYACGHYGPISGLGKICTECYISNMEELKVLRQALSRRVKVENILIEHYGKKTSPTPQECFELAKMLGIPEEHQNAKVQV